MLTINSLCAATGVIIPVQCEYYALEGISQLLKTINLIQANLNPALIIEGLLLTMYDTRTNLSTQVAEEIREYFGGQVYQTYIPRNVRISESPSFGQPVIIYDRKSSGAQAYLSFTREVIKNE
jgi:chromosome partitioning protein